MLNYSNKNKNIRINKIKYKSRYNKFKLSHFISKHTLTISIMVGILFATMIYATYSMYSHYNKSDNIESVASVVYDNYTSPTSIITPTVIVTPTRASEMSRGGISRIDDRKPIVEPVAKDKKVVEEKVNESDVKKIDDKIGFEYVDSFLGTITKYTLAYEECLKHPWDKNYGITASGARVRPNHTIAMNRSIPFGTTVKIEGFDNIFTVTDRGGAIVGLKIDVYVESRAEAFKWGVQKRKVWILKTGNGKVK